MDLTAYVDGLVHEPTQTEGHGLDLTLASVSSVTTPGRVDFGGGELEPAEREPVPTGKRNPDDDYSWWSLRGGMYLVDLNETLSAPVDQSFVVQTRREVRERGAFHPTIHLSGGDPLEQLPLTVGDGGILLKENARISTLLPAERDG